MVGRPDRVSTELKFVSGPYIIEVKTGYEKGKVQIKFVLWSKKR